MLMGLLYLFQGMTGMTVDDGTGMYKDSSLVIKELVLNSLDENLVFSLTLENGKYFDREVEVNYELFNAEGERYASGNQSVFISGNDKQEYKFSFGLNENKSLQGSLGVEVYDPSDGDRDYSFIPIQIYRLSGNVVSGEEESNQNVRLFVALGIFAVFLIILFLIFKRKTINQNKKEIVRLVHHNGRIKLR